LGKVKSVLPVKSGLPVFTYMNKTVTTRPVPLPRLLYSRMDAAHMLSESLRSIDYKLAQGTLKYIRQGGRVKIAHAELLRQAAIDDNTPIVPRRPPQSAWGTSPARKAA
jgi:hypothetical protein